MLSQAIKGNEILNDQLKLQIEKEEQAKLQRLLKLWTDEFRHRGCSPLEAHRKAEVEYHLQELMQEATSALNGIELEKKAYFERLLVNDIKQNNRKYNKYSLLVFSVPFFLSIFVSLIPSSSAVGSQISTMLGVGLVAVEIFGPLVPQFIRVSRKKELLLKSPSAQQIKNLSLDDSHEIMQKAFQTLEDINEQLELLHPSEISDDSEFRSLVARMASRKR